MFARHAALPALRLVGVLALRARWVPERFQDDK